MTPWTTGTDLRQAGLYVRPDDQDGEKRLYYPSVTHILDSTCGSMIEAERWFTAVEVNRVTKLAAKAEYMDVWNAEQGCLIPVPARDVLLNQIPETVEYPNDDFYPVAGLVRWGKNAGLHYVKQFGRRELGRMAKRGTIMHSAGQEKVLAMASGRDWLRSDDPELSEWTDTQIHDVHEYKLALSYCQPNVETILRWLEDHIYRVFLVECPAYNDTFNFAGTIDLHAILRNCRRCPFCLAERNVKFDILPGTFQIDHKSSKEPYVHHKVQAAAYAHMEMLGVREADKLIAYPSIYTMSEPLIDDETGLDMRVSRFANLYCHEQDNGNMVAEFVEWQDLDWGYRVFQCARYMWSFLEDDINAISSKKRAETRPTKSVAQPKMRPEDLKMPGRLQRKINRTITQVAMGGN